ncbi:FAD dependent oxidoreductase protein (plasmid) [Rhizobium phaseoli]|uniref:NAD(P)/FAD-dependent oxidoreductase n=1 Tax=Rhizobium phaseoli TaxID=396 RepID=UPI0007EBAD46|nr:FAD-binding oxidoreductase [Rhizobium phaseoli]ANL31098.1 FAD dependent oxidoreductase protein [Rhizobium phaseoli]ANL69031.1 FAD dependent oxidoreductase protein [Rhizobium phaseoli]ANL75486.1 FAD dependent oxidoreductase protein [Rhizobium phaseoli]ANL81830.1 FAD dependent oxidoreductase protein [Rhizobium phaseoli]
MSRGAKNVFVASRLPKRAGVSRWVATLPPRRPRPALSEAILADVAIIGGGFAGLSAAHRLSQLDPTLRVALFEAGIVGEGPAGANSGFIIDLPHEVSSDDFSGESEGKFRDSVLLQRSAIALASQLASENRWGEALFDPCGRYSIAMSEEGDRHLEAYSQQLSKMGEAHRLLKGKEIEAVTGSKAFTSGLFSPGTVIIQPAAYVRSAAECLKAPVRLYERTPVLSFERSGDGWLLKTPHGSVQAAKIILANNGHAESFGFFRRRLLHVFTYASMTEEFDPARLGGDRKWAATPALPMGTTVRRINTGGGDRILIRSRYSYNPGIEITDAAIRSAGGLHDRKFAHRFPALAGVGMQYRWGGAMALTHNHVPAFGEIERGVFAACGCNGLGASNSTAAGMAAAERVLGHQSELVGVYSRLAAPVLLPPQPLTTIGAKIHLAWREWRAGTE